MPDDDQAPLPLPFRKPPPVADPIRAEMRASYLMDETRCVEARLDEARRPAVESARVEASAGRLVTAVRATRPQEGVDALLQEYELSSREGVVLMCLAEALLRIPDAATRDALIREKIMDADWEAHLGHSSSLFVNASTWALMLTGRLMRLEGRRPIATLRDVLRRLAARSGEPLIRQAVTQAMRVLGRQFVIGRTIEEALDRAKQENGGERHSFDMLGEAAQTAGDANRYLDGYANAIEVVGRRADGGSEAGISIKLSALHPRFEFSQRDRIMAELAPRLLELARLAREWGVGLTVDAEEASRLEPTLDVFEEVYRDPTLAGWEGMGIAVQAYQKRALPVVDWLAALARARRRRIVVRLVKGAYWDTEIKRAQEQGLPGYPVFTRKVSTDASYLACAARLLAAENAILPAFATHNAHTVAAVLDMAADRRFEFQRLHGMGEALYDAVRREYPGSPPCRVYAPVGSHDELLPYLVRRLLENGANTSFVNRLTDEGEPIENIVADPVASVSALSVKPHPRIPLPRDLYGAGRVNSAGVDLSDVTALVHLSQEMAAAVRHWRAEPVVGGKAIGGAARPVCSPSDRRRIVGTAIWAEAEHVEAALDDARRAQPSWDERGGVARADILLAAADLFEQAMPEFMALAILEGGKTVNDAVAEVREAVDFLRYYAVQGRKEFAVPQEMPGPTGEANTLSLAGRGTFVCISPWNFPLAIFTGQVAAALAAGNAAIAKPAEQTPLIAARAIQLLHAAGVPPNVLHFLPGEGGTLGQTLVADARIQGVVFTGSTETARAINRTLAARSGPIVPLIAETGGQNAMIVDSSALTEQVVRDVIASAFRSAGQRCSALRVLFLQEEIAERTMAMLVGAMVELRVGDPALLETDVGPIIDGEALAMLGAHAARMEREARHLATAPLGCDSEHGTFFAPRAFEIDSIGRLNREVFGPILHVVRYPRDGLDDVVDAINATGFGLTLGIHSRIDATIERVRARARIGNVYVNRNQIGAVVGAQPFGGEGLSGTGPKAGGPHYLHRFAVERAVSHDTTASGGNAALLALEEQ